MSVLLAAKPGRLRESLVAFLRAAPDTESVEVVDDSARALEAAAGHNSRLNTLVVDGDVGTEASLAIVRQLRTDFPALNIVVLAGGVQCQRVFRAAGASHVLLKGTLDDRLQAAVAAPLQDKTLNQAAAESERPPAPPDLQFQRGPPIE